MNPNAATEYLFGPFRLDRRERLLTRAGVSVPITGKVFELLELFVVNAGRALSKQELMAALWPDVVVLENNLAVHVNTLRRVLSESAAQRYVETLPRRGYRFVATVTTVDGARPDPHGAEPIEPRPLPSPSGGALPAETSRFIGREAELARLLEVLSDPSQRLVTLLAPGGMGKSRLALEAGRRLARGGDVGVRPLVFWVDLAPLTLELLPAAIARALGLGSWGGGELVEVGRVLGERRALLVIDNFEHLLEGAPWLARLLEQVPGLTVLVTSRQALRLECEMLLPVLGLCTPERDSEGHELEFDSVRLFAETAARAGFDIAANTGDLRATARICQLLGGMPLGILLAASWTHVLGARDIESEIRSSLDFLRSDWVDLPERQRSLRAVFEQSWRLLGTEDATVLGSLSVFRGGFDRRAAEEVARAAPATLARLVNSSFLRREPQVNRYQIHELLRQFADTKLGRAEAADARDRHADYFARFLHAREPALRAPDSAVALREIELDIDNVRGAFRWMVERQQLGNVSRSIEALNLFYERRGAHGEAASVFTGAASQLGRSALSTTQEAAQLVRMAIRSQQACAHWRGTDPPAPHLLWPGAHFDRRG